jgi:hypothetical protein
MYLRFIFLIIFFSVGRIIAQELPEEEIQANINTYFDNFDVNIIYPTVSAVKNFGSSTSVNARILVDVISAASTRCHFDSVYSFMNLKNNIVNKSGKVDAFTSATKMVKDGGHGGGDNTPDELRGEFVFGITQFFDEISVSVNNIYSQEHDYSSETVSGSVNIPMAKKNTILKVGVIKSWDKNFPKSRLWTGKKDVITANATLSQIFTQNFHGQFEFSYSNLSGYLSDPYQIVQVWHENNTRLDSVSFYEPISPDKRNRYALGIRGLYGLDENSSITLGYRYYADDWKVQSHTISTLYQRQVYDDNILYGIGWRIYFQLKADFYKETYYTVEQYMTVDPKLKDLYSNELQFKITLNGKIVPLIYNEKYEVNGNLNIYQRTTTTSDWFSRKKTLYAYLFSFGFRYLL